MSITTTDAAAAAQTYANRYATPPNRIVRERVYQMQLSLMIDPYGFKMSECKHCGGSIAKRVGSDGSTTVQWRHLRNAYGMCPNQSPNEAGRYFFAESKVAE